MTPPSQFGLNRVSDEIVSRRKLQLIYVTADLDNEFQQHLNADLNACAR
jgi:hypothetical protein